MSDQRDELPPPQRDLHRQSSSSGAPARNPPLVIVSERGRHSEASRRIVRAQAARASAAQSRETRARNREDRHQRDGPQSPSDSNVNPPQESQPQQPQRTPAPQTSQHSMQRNPSEHQQGSTQTPQQGDDSQTGGTLKPLVNWITNILRLSAQSFATGAALVATGMPPMANASDVLSRAGGIVGDSGHAMEEVQVTGSSVLSRRLPIALPRGFVALQQRLQISDAYLVLLSRTACFDFGSQGVENRLNELLYDIVMTSATATVAEAAAGTSAHPIEGHLRIACACLTIFQGQRADGQSFAHDQRYPQGLAAAWEEVLTMDIDILKEPKSAEAALWAIYTISVTCGTPGETFFYKLLFGLMQDLQLHQWDDVRTVLLDFIYPGSFLDEPCKNFFDQLRSEQRTQAVAG